MGNDSGPPVWTPSSRSEFKQTPVPPAVHITRLAPSPTGALHLGNARTFLVNWALARAQGWRIVLRIEDLDGPRIKRGAAAGIVDTLTWLGLDWDEGPLFQSADVSPYVRAMQTLAGAGRVYPTDRTRADGEEGASAPQASAPGAGAHEAHFGAHLRPGDWQQPRAFVWPEEGAPRAWRLATPDEAVAFVDGAAGPQTHHPARSVGDFVVWTKQGVPAYQLAVVVDDARQGVTQVVRGDDLLDSAARQVLLMRALFGPAHAPPAYTHLPLVLGEDGRRLAKRHGDTRLDHYRQLGVRPERVIGLLAFWSGVLARPEAMSARDFAGAFALDRLPRATVVMSAKDHAWLQP